MKKTLIAMTLSTLAVPAFAADVVMESPPEPVATEVVTAFDWSGAYVGLQAGGIWVDGKFSVPGASEREHFNGGTIGKFAGYNYMIDNILVGVEGDVNYSWNENSYSFNGTSADVGTDWSGSIRARLGYSFDQVVVFATAGYALANGYIDTPGKEWNRTFHGWTVGAGVDYAFTENMFVRAEYRFTDYSTREFQGVDVSLDQHTATVGIGFKF